jgi:putative FmdB family regulatory protein
MPIYEYVCEDCNANFKSIRTMKDANTVIPCKSCQGENTNRALSTCYTKTTGGSASSSSGSGWSGGDCYHCN